MLFRRRREAFAHRLGMAAGTSEIHERPTLAKEALLTLEGLIDEILPDGRFGVTLDNQHRLICYTAGKMRKFRIRTGVGDRVIVEMSPYDLQRGRISFRHKGDAPTPGPQQRRPNKLRDVLRPILGVQQRLGHRTQPG